MAAVTELLKKVAIFHDLEDDDHDPGQHERARGKVRVGRVHLSRGRIREPTLPHRRGRRRISRDVPGSGEEALAVLKPGAIFGEMSVFDRSERSTDAISNGGTRTFTISRTDFEMLLDLNRELAFKVLWACVRLLSARLRTTNDSLRSFLAMSMF